MRYEPRGNYGHPLDRMAHKFNMTVPGVVGYRPQRADAGAYPFEVDTSADLTGADIYEPPNNANQPEFDE